MRGYAGIERSLSACLHFVRNNEVDGDALSEMAQDLKLRRIICAYVDYRDIDQSGESILDRIGDLLVLKHRPYGSHLVRFLDDLITLSEVSQGSVIVIDRADIFFAKARNRAFDLIEAFLIQFHHWLEKKKPCHLCFQMEENPLIGRTFRSL